MVIVHCTSSHCAWPLYEVVLNSTTSFQVTHWTKE
jgi:hypothetical protein